MADFAAELPTSGGTVITQRTGTTNSDTVPAGALVIARNTGVGSHTLTFTIGYLYDGQAVSSKVVTIAAGAASAIRVPSGYGDPSTGRVPLAINGTANEVLYWVVS